MQDPPKEARVEICRDRHDWRSCKICSSCVNFPGKQCDFSHNLNKATRFTHTKCDFCTETVKILRTQLYSNKKTTKIADMNASTLFLLE